MLGEFETGETGSYIKVYLNEGTDDAPDFTGEYIYATDINGDTISNFQWCCIGIHPRLVDIDGDGYLDILSGQYNPGAISLWRGSKDGFLPREFIEQEGWAEGGDGTGMVMGGGPPPPEDSPRAFSYWNYTSANFGDFNGDGLPDLFVGGSGGPRVALNAGTKENPKFGLRKYLQYGGIPNSIDSRTRRDYEVNCDKSYLHPVDWDNDGIMDILMTHEYAEQGQNVIEFFKGVQTPEGLRFEKPVPLFYTEETSQWGHASRTKAFPGCQPMITVVDYNNDGILDIVIGVSIPTIDGFECVPEVAWEWAHDLGIQMPGKDAGRSINYSGGVEGTIKKIESEPQYKRHYMGKLDDYKYLTMRHRGYVFVMYGSENPEKAGPAAIADSQAAYAGGGRQEEAHTDNQVSFDVELPEEVIPGKEYTARVVFSFRDGWHGYADSPGNKAQGFIPTKAEFVFPDGVKTGSVNISTGSLIYEGSGISFSQSFTFPKKAAKGVAELPVTVNIQWQVCDANMCLPPENTVMHKSVRLK